MMSDENECDIFNEDIKKFCGIEIVLDDTFLDRKDKKNLILHLKELYENKFPWAAEYLIKCFILTHYKAFIEKMNEGNNIEEYLKEKEEQDTDFNIDRYFNS